MKHLLSFSAECAILKRAEHFILNYLLMVFMKAFHSSAAWISFRLDLAQLYLTAKGAKSSSVLRHICDVTPHAGMIYLLCEVVCICPSRSFMSSS